MEASKLKIGTYEGFVGHMILSSCYLWTTTIPGVVAFWGGGDRTGSFHRPEKIIWRRRFALSSRIIYRLDHHLDYMFRTSHICVCVCVWSLSCRDKHYMADLSQPKGTVR